MRISMPFACYGLTSSKLIIAGVTAALLSGCSDSIDRFSANYNNPSDNDPVYTASVPQTKRPIKRTYAQPKALAYNEETIVQNPIARAPLNKPKAPSYDYVQSYKKPYKQPSLKPQALAYDEQPVAPIYKKPAYKAPVYSAPNYGSEEVVADSQNTPAPTPAAPAPTFTYKKKIAPAAATAATVRVGDGMTLYSIAKANGMTVQQLAEANGIAQPYTVSTGRVLRIPGATSAQLPQTALATPMAPKKKVTSLAEEEQTAQVAPAMVKAGSAYNVQNGDTLYSLGRKFNVSPFTIASLNGLDKGKALSLGQKIKIPAGASAAVAQIPLKKPLVAEQEQISDDTADAGPATKPAPLALPKTKVTDPAQATVQDVPAIPTDAGSGLAMRWPVRGKVISDFGKKPNGLKNEGINISVPEGTSIRAAESGVVAYAGNELKGYGNLILIRHAGGYVTAYAHAKALNVKRGDTVKRGDVIAVAGQTGAVQSPQLHFEVRKGATALDPTKYLSSSTASN
jgi:murein DD-endopeptidase MepM/ murein hydrolase activator NlpD